MHIEQIYLRNFRSYEKAHFVFDSGVNWIVGENAQGKTNLLEALVLLSTGRSFRAKKTEEMIKEGSPGFYIEALVSRAGVSERIKLSYDGTERAADLNGTKHASFTPLLGYLPSVLFAPSDRAIIEEDPKERRDFLDLQIAQTDPTYLEHVLRYNKAMRQRNDLLKQNKTDGISAWEESMALAAEQMISRRIEAVTLLAPQVTERMMQLTEGRDTIGLSYMCKLANPSALSARDLKLEYEKSRPRDLELGRTCVGPHLDELLITISGKEAKRYASEGQKRSLLSALRLAEWHQLSSRTTERPFMCVDDMPIHFDAFRQELLARALGSLGQVFVTSPEAIAVLPGHTIAIKR
jgi:DNA replication and repair protein RecF